MLKYIENGVIIIKNTQRDNMKPKSINSLMAHMRDEKQIQISGSLQKKKLRAMGYFHGYKGYRYYNIPSNLFPFSDFNEL